MSTIKKYTKIPVNIVKVTKVRGVESTTLVPADVYVSTRRVVIRDASGSHAEEKTVLLFKPDADVTRKDKVLVDGVTMPVLSITGPRFVGRTSPNHLEVTLD